MGHRSPRTTRWRHPEPPRSGGTRSGLPAPTRPTAGTPDRNASPARRAQNPAEAAGLAPRRRFRAVPPCWHTTSGTGSRPDLPHCHLLPLIRSRTTPVGLLYHPRRVLKRLAPESLPESRAPEITGYPVCPLSAVLTWRAPCGSGGGWDHGVPGRPPHVMDRRTLLLAGLAASLSGCSDPAPESSSTEPPVPSANPATGSTAPAGTGNKKPLKIGFMPKIKGIPYFQACERGAKEAAAELGGIELIYDGPVDAKSEEQSAMVDTWVLRKFDAICVACNDPDQIAPTLARARDAGITVVTYDADSNPSASRRQFFVNQATTQDLVETLVDQMAQQAGEDAQVGVVSSSPTAPNQSMWLKGMEAYRKQKYPRMQVVVTEYAGENQNTSLEKAQAVLKAFPQVKGIWGMTSVAFPGAAQAVEQAGKKGQVAVIGLGTPKDMKEFVDRGIVKSVILWNPVDLGYLAVQVAAAVARGELKEGDSTVQAGRLKERSIQGTEIVLGKPLVFTPEN
ncbi:MAG: autoinducer 2 ABC transporter substrate-binding protein, partial [Armatimonadetes bacterium]|nr:autoinducer 2 ABC transporter substrate-binding protein [Armatimonadota bacterium]